MSRITPLTKRSDFLKLKTAPKVQTRLFLLQGGDLARGAHDGGGPRVGFIITKKMGNAVQRNRMRRRLKEVLRQHASDLLRDEFSYVFLCRRALLSAEHAQLVQIVRDALAKCHHLCNQNARD